MSTPDSRDLHFEPGKLWSLWDLMDRIDANRFLNVFNTAQSVASWTAAMAVCRPDYDRTHTHELMQRVFSNFRDWEGVHLWLPESHGIALRLEGECQVPGVDLNRISHGMGTLVEVMVSEASKVLMVAVGSPAHYEVERPLGDAVYEAFPTARYDLTESWNCFACDRFAASIHHGILAAEIGLRELARDRRITHVHKRNPIPLDQAQWGHILGELDKRLAAIAGWDKGAPRDAADRFYKPAILEANALNDGWRRHLSHGRGIRYERDEAEAMLGHVRRFLQRLAKRLGEGRSVTPLVWKRVPEGLA